MRYMTYIAGKMTAPTKKQMRANLDRFYQKEKELLEKGVDVHNPAHLEDKGDQCWEWFLARDVVFITRNRPKMYFLKDWENSPGARLEHAVADYLGLEIEYE